MLGIPERPKGGGHLAAMNCVGELQRVLHQCCGILVKPLSAFFGYPPFDFIFKFLLMAFVSHNLGQLSHPFPLSLLATMLRLVVALVFLGYTAATPLLWDGRAPFNLTNSDLNASIGPFLT